ncbi:MAG: class I tRNA ligase family protein, partial [Thalassotalea sp.]|nr:class I tRNA ligase family protein [Thalassotalea sp.]
SDSGVEGAHLFVKRVYKIVHDFTEAQDSEIADSKDLSLNSSHKNLRRELHKTITKVTDDIGRRNTFNTAIAAIMELMNNLAKAKLESEADKAVMKEAVQAIVLMLTPITPHLGHELWNIVGDGTVVEEASWPVVDEAALVQDEKLVIVQVNGKLRSKVTVSAQASQEDVEKLAFAEENVVKFTEGKTVRKIIYVPGKLLNIVAN